MRTSQESTNDTQTKEYSIVRLTKDNLIDVAKLHAEVYGVAQAVDYFPKKYDTAYTGIENIGFIAYNRDKLAVAFYGVIPCFIQYENNIILAAQSADTMTHPQHRYKGMFVELSNMTFDLCRQSGIPLIFGFPNQNSYHGAVNKLGWKMTGVMTCFIIPVKSLPFEAFSRRLSIFNKFYQRYRSFILSKHSLPLQGIANSVLADGFAGVCRNDDYLQYKAYSPGKVIGIDDSKIWISNKYGLLIGDMEGIHEMNFATVISKLKKIAKRLGLRQIQFHCSADTRLYEIFAANYKAMPSYPMLFQDFGSAIPPEKIRFTFADIDVF